MPVLYYVPIIHSIEDYGSLGPSIQKAFTQKLGKTAFDELQKQIRGYWQIIEERIAKEIPDVQGLVIYQDGLPVGEREKVRALFGHMCEDHPESPNLQLVKKLLEKGAVLEGTEDMSLVLEQIEIYKHIAQASSPEEQKNIRSVTTTRSNEIMQLRDAFIARRIRDTLPENGRAVLFIGREHRVIGELEKLPGKITVICL